MFCCALGAVFLAAVALWRNRLRALFVGRVAARSTFGLLFVIGLALAGFTLLIDHFGHAVALAKGEGLLAEMDGQSLCRADPAFEPKE